MKPQFTPGSQWLHLPTETEHTILAIYDEDVQTISPPEAYLLPESTLEKTPIQSWHGSHAQFHKEFTPAVAA